MPARKNWKELLSTKSTEDKASNLTINNINLGECEKISSRMRCEFMCNCGEKGNKDITQIIIKNTGLFCTKCTEKKEKRKN